ncbi:MAG: threonine synthase [Spirochaetaceae bacterium]|nr:MAG: threonine synthase [Spirochaetaceae bacterium]
MKFVSTRNPGGPTVSFPEALFRGIAPDGGLYHPVEEPDLRALVRSLGEDASYVDCAAALIEGLFGEDHDAEQARRLALKAFPFQPRLRSLGPGMELLELFHGPSCAFKDFGASFLAATMEEELLRGGGESYIPAGRAIILTATSGDTGSAVAHAFAGRRNIDVVILYPSGRVSPLQEKQLTTLGGNILALEVRGSFDDCQRMVKEAFSDPDLAGRLTLTSANSINVGRLIPQSFYYVYAFAQLREREEDELVFCVPSGNFGNLTAGILAWHWGMPVSGFIAATNANDVVPRFLETGVFTPRPSVKTLANAMDVGNPSNFERLQHLFGGAGSMPIRGLLTGLSVPDAVIAATMKKTWETRGELLCPHTAAGVYAAQTFLDAERAENTLVVTLATAHPAKFVEVCREAVGVEPEIPERLACLLERPKQSVLVDNTLHALSRELLNRFT